MGLLIIVQDTQSLALPFEDVDGKTNTAGVTKDSSKI